MREHQCLATGPDSTVCRPMISRWFAVGMVLAATLLGPATKAEQAGDAAAQANNPLANMTTMKFNMRCLNWDNRNRAMPIVALS
jgi:hypothetical protein